MTYIINRPLRRFFAFGCSFTRYYYTTWPDIIASDIMVPQYFNLACSGGGNEFIFNRVMQVDQLYDINENDLVMVCWTNVTREDRYIDKNWVLPGNIYTQNTYPEGFVKQFYKNPENLVLHDFAFIKAVRSLLEYKKCQWHFLQMLPLFDTFNQWSMLKPKTWKFSNLTHSERTFFKPSFYEVLWNNNINSKIKSLEEKYAYVDAHPSPFEHFSYLNKIFKHDWRADTITKINELEQQYDGIFKSISCDEDIDDHVFDHIRQPEELSKIY